MSIKFAFVADENKQIVEVSTQAINIIPEMEPEAEIKIPEKTFENAGKLELKV